MQRELHAALLQDLPGAATDPQQLTLIASDIADVVAARWPAWVDGETFGRYLAARVDPGVELLRGLGELAVGDLYLACACVHGVAAAHLAFEREHVAALPAALRSIDPGRDFAEEVLQLLREKMLVAHAGEPPRLESYSGHGPLGGWLRVSALRIALSLRRRAHPTGDDDDLAALLDPSPGAEVAVLAARLGADLRASLRQAVADQPARTRAVLRLYYADGRGVEDIGRVYRVHASTVSRWLAKARADILAATRAHLVARLDASESEIDSLLAHAASVEISLGSVLRSRPVEPAP